MMLIVILGCVCLRDMHSTDDEKICDLELMLSLLFSHVCRGKRFEAFQKFWKDFFLGVKI